MQICGSCGKEVRYIAGSYDKTYTCEAREEEFVTASGHILKGYPLHICNKDTSNTNTDNKHEQSKEKR